MFLEYLYATNASHAVCDKILLIQTTACSWDLNWNSWDKFVLGNSSFA